MKRRSDNKRSPSEIKADNFRHYGALAESTPAEEVKESFRRPAYKTKRCEHDDKRNE